MEPGRLDGRDAQWSAFGSPRRSGTSRPIVRGPEEVRGAVKMFLGVDSPFFSTVFFLLLEKQLFSLGF